MSWIILRPVEAGSSKLRLMISSPMSLNHLLRRSFLATRARGRLPANTSASSRACWLASCRYLSHLASWDVEIKTKNESTELDNSQSSRNRCYKLPQSWLMATSLLFNSCQPPDEVLYFLQTLTVQNYNSLYRYDAHKLVELLYLFFNKFLESLGEVQFQCGSVDHQLKYSHRWILHVIHHLQHETDITQWDIVYSI